MEPHFLSTLFSISMMVMLAHAALPPELYWKMMLPTTPVPEAITEQLSLGGDIVSSGKSVDDAETQSQNLFRLFHGSKEIAPQETGPFLFNGAKGTQILSYDTNLWVYKNGAKETQLHNDINPWRYKNGASLHQLLLDI